MGTYSSFGVARGLVSASSMKCFLVAVFLLFYSLSCFAILAAETSCALRNQTNCTLVKECHWNNDTSLCLSALPCVLETSETDCLGNTWKCEWRKSSGPSPSGCRSNNRSLDHNAASQPLKCSLLDSPEVCAQDKTCQWRSGSCHRKPTIILSVADDLGWHDVGWRNRRFRTPVLSRLKEEGIELTRHYGFYMCSPSRAMLFTGRPAWRMGSHTGLNMLPPTSVRCGVPMRYPLLPALFKDTGGYVTHGFGKWHLGHHNDALTPTKRGFDSYIGFYTGSIGQNVQPDMFQLEARSCKNRLCDRSGFKGGLQATAHQMIKEVAGQPTKIFNGSRVAEDAGDLFLANRIKETIEWTPPDDPLFLYIGWIGAHIPATAPQRYIFGIISQNVTFGTDATSYKQCGIDSRIRLSHSWTRPIASSLMS